MGGPCGARAEHPYQDMYFYDMSLAQDRLDAKRDTRRIVWFTVAYVVLFGTAFAAILL